MTKQEWLALRPYVNLRKRAPKFTHITKAAAKAKKHSARRARRIATQEAFELQHKFNVCSIKYLS